MRKFCKQNLSLDFKLQSSFDFKFAANCQVFISFLRNRYTVCRVGYHNDNGVILFNKKAFSRVRLKTLFQAIQYFVYEVNLICSQIDWYNPDLFDSSNFYEFANEKVIDDVYTS